MEQKSVKRKGMTDENAMMAMIFSTPEHQVIKIYHRSNSEKIIRREKVEKKCCGLRRSNTEIRSLKTCGCSKEGHYPEDHMTNEEFQKTIEDFIAKQQRFLREEEFSVLEE
ncbi:Chitinase-like protein 3 [Bienertia sinuspersici]